MRAALSQQCRCQRFYGQLGMERTQGASKPDSGCRSNVPIPYSRSKTAGAIDQQVAGLEFVYQESLQNRSHIAPDKSRRGRARRAPVDEESPTSSVSSAARSGVLDRDERARRDPACAANGPSPPSTGSAAERTGRAPGRSRIVRVAAQRLVRQDRQRRARRERRQHVEHARRTAACDPSEAAP